MKIATGTVSLYGFGNPACFDVRLQVFKTLIIAAKTKGVQFVCLPGGFFSVESESDLGKTATRIVAEARKERIAVALGIDCGAGQSSKKNKGSTDMDSLVRKEKLPSFAIAWSPQQDREIWRQRSTTSKNQWLVPTKSCEKPQTVQVAGNNIEILMCGELFNERIRDKVIERKPTALVDLSHVGQGFRPDNALRGLAEKGIHTFCCTHADVKSGMKRGYAAGGKKISSRKIDLLIAGPPRIELKFDDI